MAEETKPVEREATKQANDLLRRLSREMFQDGIDIEQLPHAVGLVMDFAQASADAALERAAQLIEQDVSCDCGFRDDPKNNTYATGGHAMNCPVYEAFEICRALKGRE